MTDAFYAMLGVVIAAAIEGGVALAIACHNTKISKDNNSEIKKSASENKMFNAKQTILQMVNEDYIAVEVRKTLPTNHSRILYEYDIYKANGGNSDIDEKMEEYRKWYSSLNLEV